MEEKKNPGKEEKKARTADLPAAPGGPFTDDLIVEILSRLPPRSVHRFKCVSPSWRDLIADPAHRKKLRHTLAGFLYDTYSRVDPRFHVCHFASVSAVKRAPPAVDPSLPFLPPDEYLYVAQLDTCNGLLLCRAHMAAHSPPSSTDEDMLQTHYVVCNPATGKWVDLPAPHRKAPTGARVMARLAFDPAVSSQFHVFEFTDQEEHIRGANIYSSRTGAWNHRVTRCVEKFELYFGLTGVFFRGMLHLLGWLHPMSFYADAVLVAVDMEGQVWETIRVPSGGISFCSIGLSQGSLHYATTPLVVVDKSETKDNKKRNEEDTSSLYTNIASVWFMKDYDSKEWVLKHTLSHDELRSITAVDYKVAAIHPDCDTIFLDSCEDNTLASYDMRCRKFQRICHLEENKAYVFLPYVPLFSDSFAGTDGQ